MSPLTTAGLAFVTLLLAVLLPEQGDAAGGNWAVLTSASRYWHNYRHGSNVMSVYQAARSEGGMSDDNIVLMLAESYACDPRNPLPGTLYNNADKAVNLYSCGSHPDVLGYELTAAKYTAVLQDRHTKSTPLAHRMQSDNESNVLVYITGHGNKGFIKFHDTEFYSAEDFADSFEVMYRLGRYKKLLFIADTCNAESLCLEIRSPNVVCIASSSLEENSYSHHGDPETGLEVIDRFGYELLQMVMGMEGDRWRLGGASTPKASLREVFGRMRLAAPTMQPAINDPTSLDTWTLAEFLSPAAATHAPSTFTPTSNIFDD